MIDILWRLFIFRQQLESAIPVVQEHLILLEEQNGMPGTILAILAR